MQALQSATSVVTDQAQLPSATQGNTQESQQKSDVNQSASETVQKTEKLGSTLTETNASDLPTRVAASVSRAAQKTPLVKHVAYFTDSDGKVTQSSIYLGFRKLGFTHFDAFLKSVIIAGMNGGVDQGCPFARVAATNIHKMVHPCHSGVFKEDGTIDSEAWEKLKTYAQLGKEFLSQIDIKRMQDEAKAKDKEKDPLGIWEVASQGEWGDLFRIACDHWELIDGEYVPCLTFATLSSLFNDGPQLFERIENGELPVKKPTSTTA